MATWSMTPGTAASRLCGGAAAHATVAPEQFVCFRFDGRQGLYIHPNIWREGVFALKGTQRFFDRQGAVHVWVSVGFARVRLPHRGGDSGVVVPRPAHRRGDSPLQRRELSFVVQNQIWNSTNGRAIFR